jgi:hypothetical protein
MYNKSMTRIEVKGEVTDACDNHKCPREQMTVKTRAQSIERVTKEHRSGAQRCENNIPTKGREVCMTKSKKESFK